MCGGEACVVCVCVCVCVCVYVACVHVCVRACVCYSCAVCEACKAVGLVHVSYYINFACTLIVCTVVPSVCSYVVLYSFYVYGLECLCVCLCACTCNRIGLSANMFYAL